MDTTIRKELQTIFRKVFENNTLEILDTSNAKSIADWNSLNHMILINEIEQFFKIQFSYQEVIAFETVGDMIKLIHLKCNK
jgi:acyl carrier protein